MKKYLIIAASLFLASACQKEASNNEAPAIDADLVTISAALPEGTKVAFADQDTVLKFAWETGDAIDINGKTFTLVSGQGTKVGIFQGEVPDTVAGKYTAVFPASLAEGTSFKDRAYSGQVQKGNASTAHLSWNATVAGMTDYREFNFTSEWAAANGATFSQNGVVRFTVKLPAEITEVTQLRLTAPTNAFRKYNWGSVCAELAMDFEDCTVGADGILTAYMMSSVTEGAFEADNSYAITVVGTDKSCVKTFTNGSAKISLAAGKMSTIKLNMASGGTVFSGKGLETSPFVITTPAQMNLMKNLIISAGATRYFELGNDIDLAGISWTPLVTGNQCKPFVLDGKNHTINHLTVDTEVSFPSFAGVMDGTVRNVTFANANVANKKSTAQQTAIVAAWAGRNDGDITATFENVNITDSKVTNLPSTAGSCITGLLAGQANGLTAKNCHATGNNVVEAGSDGKDNHAGAFIGLFNGKQYNSAYRENLVDGCSCNATTTINGRIGSGFIGNVYIPATIKNSNSTGTLSAPGGGQFGGFIGVFKGNGGKSTVTDCYTEVAVTTKAGSGNHASFVGYIEVTGLAFTRCYAKGNVTSPGSSSAGTGGFAGGINKGGNTFTGCWYEGDINSNAGVTGGFVGFINGATNIFTDCHAKGTIYTNTNQSNGYGGFVAVVSNSSQGTRFDRCWFEGTIHTKGQVTVPGTSGGSYIGGFIGAGSNTNGVNFTAKTATKNNDIQFTNCYTKGTIYDANLSTGGFCGEARTGYVFKNCFSTMSVTAGHRMGGFIGGALDNMDTASDFTASYGITVEKCIAWNTAIKSWKTGGIPTSNWSAGMIIGVTVHKNTLKDCYRPFDYTDFNCHAYYNDLFNQENSDENTALTFSGYTGDPQWGYFHPYHGKEANYGETLSAVAQRIGWSTDVWDFSAEVPALK